MRVIEMPIYKSRRKMDKYSVHSDIRGDVAVITTSGRFDSETAPSLDAELSKIADEKNKIVPDLKGVDYLSSSGLRAIVKALPTVQNQAAESGWLAHLNQLKQFYALLA
jgi:anti-anti-sigma factor